MNKDHRLKKWIALYTKPRHEKIVLRELEKKGFQTYLPLLKERRKWSDRKRWVEFPMFKSYIFVKTELKESIFIIQTSGVVKIIKFGNKIATIQNSIIDSLKLMIEGGYEPIPVDYFLKGDPVRVREGPLKGLIGQVIRIDNYNSLVFRIDAIQHSVSVKINMGFLEPI
tara:strand:- start:100 stop:606 length:507 start_codon:yes stop_codon:yes gene_type:complete